ncbi:MAG TPA: RloB family protein [Candidatus Lachnoclostridium stercoravium]|uniref:RloB family protein n=1 Tax=Candidatus Lachnoclostridium stercoravium TaxID=2838633 RepID=A0A9D2HHG0_9FIRM|nr:RloB family protein [Candidatus Lachnoclostridium stercoravium]
MGRTQLSPQRLSETKKANIGRIIIFCEGKTEKFYFDYFAEIIKKNKYTDIEVVLKTANGNARTVLNCAEEFMSDEENNQKYNTYGKYLAFDCDDPPDIQAVIQAAKDYELLISNHLFEIWLLMHFEDIEEKISKREIYRHLSFHLHNNYSKGHRGKTREIIQNGSIEKAIDNARNLEKRYLAEGKNVFSDIKDMNPFTNVYKLVEQFMVEISG